MTPVLNVAQAAQLSNRHPVTIRRALEAGELHGAQQRARGRWAIDPACLEAWVYARPCEHQANVSPMRRRAS